jgi:DnaJ-class molecular chaperone
MNAVYKSPFPKFSRLGLSIGLLFLVFLYYQNDFQQTVKVKSYYDLLEVSPYTSTKSDIKKRYYDLSKKYHPDMNQEEDTTELFIEVKEAYDTLTNPDRKTYYDLFLQKDFSTDDKIKQELKLAFKDNPEL